MFKWEGDSEDGFRGWAPELDCLGANVRASTQELWDFGQVTSPPTSFLSSPRITSDGVIVSFSEVTRGI